MYSSIYKYHKLEVILMEKKQPRQETHYDFNQVDIMKEIEGFFLRKLTTTKVHPSEDNIYPR